MKKEKFGVMIYPATPKYNVGDYVQSLAARQYLPSVDTFVEREKLSAYEGDPVNMIMNGWYIHDTSAWPPSPKINPLFVSFHINSHAVDGILTDEGVSYLKKHQPIGCRDFHTERLLLEKGVDAYYSGCLTTTLDIDFKSTVKTDKIYFADPLFQLPNWEKMNYSKKAFVKGILKGEFLKFSTRDNILKSLFSENLLNKAEWIPHKLSGSHSEERRFKEAEDVLKKYASAKFVVTSRIHCALPCLAVGTPVIFLNFGFDQKMDLCRFEGITNLFNTINLDSPGIIEANLHLPTGKIEENFKFENPDRYVEFASKLKEKAAAFVSSVRSAE